MSDTPKQKQMALTEAKVHGRTLEVDLWYPSVGDNVDAVEVGLMDVRAADSIRISYDFERNGWSIKQASTFSWETDDGVCDPDWQEVAFVQAWARDREEDGSDES